MRKKEGNQVFGVIGTGRFGLAVAEELLARGKYVIAIDQDQQRLKPLYETDAEVFVISDISKESLMEAGIQDADTVIVGIGKDVESSILAALNSLELGVKNVICKVILKRIPYRNDSKISPQFYIAVIKIVAAHRMLKIRS